jgi:glycosyltransferase involved in cell wall biosynthesis
MRRYRPLLGLSVLIATHRRPAGLRRLLTALRPQVAGRPERSIVVVNDGSHDDSYAKIADEFADMIEYLPLPKSEGLGAVRNAAISRCAGSYAVFTDDDCEPPPWWLDWLSARLQVHPEIDVVIGTTVPLWTTKDFREVLQGEWFLPRPSPVGRWEAFVTANVAIRAELLRAIGGFVPSLNIGEDTELCIRLYRAGARVVSDKDWWVRHQVGLPVLALARRYHAYGEARAAVAAAAAVPVPRGIDGSFARRAATFMRIWRSYWQRPAPQSFRRGPVTRARASLAAAVIDYAFLRGLARSNAPAH